MGAGHEFQLSGDVRSRAEVQLMFGKPRRNGSAMTIDGSVRSNLLAAIAGAKRWRGRPVHSDTIDYWRRLAHHSRAAASGPLGEPVGELIAELEAELAVVRTG
jgi:hypothetical protein